MADMGLKFVIQEDKKMNIGMWIIIIIGGLAGFLSSFYLVVSLPVVLVWKIYRSVTKGISLFD